MQDLFVVVDNAAPAVAPAVPVAPPPPPANPVTPTPSAPPFKRITQLSHTEAKAHLLKGESYFNGDFPDYISFEPILTAVDTVLAGGSYKAFQSSAPNKLSDVNYSLVANKDGRFAWRPFELIHPAIYVSLVNLICNEANWKFIVNRFEEFKGGSVECCSLPVVSTKKKDKAAQIGSWWQQVEQRSLKYSLDYTHILHTDVTDCYGSIYTHSLAWALHGIPAAKADNSAKLVGNVIDHHIQACRYGQTNGIPQGSVLMDFLAEMVLGYIDIEITAALPPSKDFKIIRYRDDYRIFANSDETLEYVLKIVSDKLRGVGMRLGTAKTNMSTNVVEGSIKPDKLAGISLAGLDKAQAKTLQKQLLRLHSFGRTYPNSGALKRLLAELHLSISNQKIPFEDLEVLVAIATDIGVVSPLTFPVIAGILSHFISSASAGEKDRLWSKVHSKMSRVPHNGYLQIWLQRVTKPKAVGIEFLSSEPICQIVNGKALPLWNSSWVSSPALQAALQTSKIVIKPADEVVEAMPPEEIDIFHENAWAY